MTTHLLERGGALERLEGSLQEVAESKSGTVVFVSGEAGIGKTALVREFSARVSGSARILSGRCDDLLTPSPLGPFLDIAAETGGDLLQLVGGQTTPYRVAHALLADLQAHAPTVLVVEDAHHADQASLDVLRILGSRAGDSRALIVATYRDDALDRWHPLRVALGEIGAATRVDRLKLEPLSVATLAPMATAHGVSVEELHRVTGGNPFFVTEALAANDERIPATVRDAVLGRAARLSDSARRLLEVVAIARPHAELWLLEDLAGDDLGALEEATASGILATDDGAVTFRHEIARLAVQDTIPLDRQRSLHRGALALLDVSHDGERDAARLAHHAAALDDAALVLRHAPCAAREASRRGAHREAARHLRGALRFVARLPPEDRGELFRRAAYELFLIVDFGGAAAAQREALACFVETGDRQQQGRALTFLAQLLWEDGSRAEGIDACKQALAALDGVPSRELVYALSQMARLLLASEDQDGARAVAADAQRLAAQLGDPRATLEALQTVGWARYFAGERDGLATLEEVLTRARSANWDAAAAVTYVIIVRTAGRLRDHAVAERYASEGLDHCAEKGLDVWRHYLLSWQSKVYLAHGDFAAAAAIAGIPLAEPCPFSRIHALVALGLVRARRGDPGAWDLLDEALNVAEPRDELQWIAPVAVARAEAAWLQGDVDDAVRETERCLHEATGTWYEAALRYWRWRCGSEEAVPDVGEQPYRLEIAGDWRAARDGWHAMGCPYDAALAESEGDDAARRQAIERLAALGAGAAVSAVRRTLRERGVRVPRGPRGPHASTRENPSQLTAREMEIFSLLADGLRNAEIAERLVISPRTAEHHVASILRKLELDSRAEAAAAAVRLGIAPT